MTSHGSHDLSSRGSVGLETLKWTNLEGSEDPASYGSILEQRCCRLSEYPLLLPFAGTRGNPRSIIRVP